ncbi:hypothetical protein DER46DRAFT_622495 [Fusarium sp. MPI-SDFR-AT-0072]|nr:hypothetical protein DER46DRAFT_622495 [Fusarium sp. MPI-SDFR-AT-0072]
MVIEGSGVPPTVYTANPNIGPGGQIYKELEHFGVYGTIPVNVNKTLDLLEGEYNCLVNTWGWRSPALSNYANIYYFSDLESSAGVQRSDTKHGSAYLGVVTKWLDSGVKDHDFGHALYGKQLRTGSQTSNICALPREKVNRSAAASIIEVKKLIGDSIQVIIDGSSGTGNYHQAWPFLTYLVNNPDDVPGLGTPVTTLHTLARVASTKVGRIIDSYRARMAFVDIGHAPAQKYYSTHKVLPERQPRYTYCNIVPLTTSGATIVHVDIKHAEEAEFAAKFAVRAHFIVQLSGKVSCRGDIGIYFVDAKEWLQLSLRVPS